jgi:hypothetical protein
MKSAIRYYLAFSRLYREHSVSQLLVFNGLYYQERIAMEVAWQTRIDVIATEGSCFEDRKYYYKVPQSSDLRPPLRETAKVALASRTPMGPDRYSRLQRFLNQSYNGCNNWVKQPPECTGLEKKIGIDPGRRGKIALFFGQVPYDSAITSCRPYISAYEAMRRTADYFISKQDWHLIIRFHPGDSLADEEENVVGKFLQLRSMPPNVSLVKGFDINTYQLMRIADIGITISSQAGLEMLGMHKPVAVIGNAIYGGLGITIDANSGLDYEELFDRALRFTPSDDWRRRTDLLLEYFIFDYLVRIDRYTGQFVEGGSDRVVQLFLDGNFS